MKSINKPRCPTPEDEYSDYMNLPSFPPPKCKRSFYQNLPERPKSLQPFCEVQDTHISIRMPSPNLHVNRKNKFYGNQKQKIRPMSSISAFKLKLSPYSEKSNKKFTLGRRLFKPINSSNGSPRPITPPEDKHKSTFEKIISFFQVDINSLKNKDQSKRKEKLPYSTERTRSFRRK